LIVGAKITAWFRKTFHLSKKTNGSCSEQEPLLGQRKGLNDEQLGAENGGSKIPAAAPSMREVLNFQVTLNMVVYFLLALYTLAYDQVCVAFLIHVLQITNKQLLPVFMHHRPQSIDDPNVSLPFKFAGGFGIDASRIGAIFTTLAVVSTLSQFLLFPPLARYLGVLRCLRISFLIFPFVYFVTPFISLLPDQRSKEIAMALLLIFRGLGGCFAFPCSTIMLTNSASSLRVLGTINGLATSVSAIGRACGPAIGGGLFTWGVKRGYLIVPFWSLSAIALLAWIPTLWLVEGEGFGGDSDSDVESVDSASQLLEDDALQSESEYGEPTNLLSHASTGSSQAVASDDETGFDPEHAAPRDSRRRGTGTSLDRMRSQSHSGRVRKRSSVPIGMGQGFRRLSTNLGSTGFGAGGSSWGGT
jgi:hypothetical protein